MNDGYSAIAKQQLDVLEMGNDVGLYDTILDHIDLIFDRPSEAQQHSDAIQSNRGITFHLPVIGYPPYKVFWTSDGPHIEAVLRYP